MARPRSTSDETIFQATAEALSETGPDGLSLAEIAKRASVSPATLVQRFANKRGLLLAFCDYAVRAAAGLYEVEKTGSALDRIFNLIDKITSGDEGDAALNNHFAFFQLDLRDEEFRRKAASQRKLFCDHVGSELELALSSGEIKNIDPKQTAEAMRIAMDGVLLAWLIDKKGSPGSRVRKQINLILSRPC